MPRLRERLDAQGIAFKVSIIDQYITGSDGRILVGRDRIIHCIGRVIDRIDGDIDGGGIRSTVTIGDSVCKTVRSVVIRIGCVREGTIAIVANASMPRLRERLDAQSIAVQIGIVGKHVTRRYRSILAAYNQIICGVGRDAVGCQCSVAKLDCFHIVVVYAERFSTSHIDRDRAANRVQGSIGRVEIAQIDRVRARMAINRECISIAWAIESESIIVIRADNTLNTIQRIRSSAANCCTDSQIDGDRRDRIGIINGVNTPAAGEHIVAQTASQNIVIRIAEKRVIVIRSHSVFDAYESIITSSVCCCTSS